MRPGAIESLADLTRSTSTPWSHGEAVRALRRHSMIALTIVGFAVQFIGVVVDSFFPLFAFRTHPRFQDQLEDHTEGVNR